MFDAPASGYRRENFEMPFCGSAVDLICKQRPEMKWKIGKIVISRKFPHFNDAYFNFR
jgi:hypothetical protein